MARKLVAVLLLFLASISLAKAASNDTALFYIGTEDGKGYNLQYLGVPWDVPVPNKCIADSHGFCTFTFPKEIDAFVSYDLSSCKTGDLKLTTAWSSFKVKQVAIKKIWFDNNILSYGNGLFYSSQYLEGKLSESPYCTQDGSAQHDYCLLPFFDSAISAKMKGQKKAFNPKSYEKERLVKVSATVQTSEGYLLKKSGETAKLYLPCGADTVSVQKYSRITVNGETSYGKTLESVGKVDDYIEIDFGNNLVPVAILRKNSQNSGEIYETRLVSQIRFANHFDREFAIEYGEIINNPKNKANLREKVTEFFFRKLAAGIPIGVDEQIAVVSPDLGSLKYGLSPTATDDYPKLIVTSEKNPIALASSDVLITAAQYYDSKMLESAKQIMDFASKNQLVYSGEKLLIEDKQGGLKEINLPSYQPMSPGYDPNYDSESKRGYRIEEKETTLLKDSLTSQNSVYSTEQQTFDFYEKVVALSNGDYIITERVGSSSDKKWPIEIQRRVTTLIKKGGPLQFLMDLEIQNKLSFYAGEGQLKLSLLDKGKNGALISVNDEKGCILGGRCTIGIKGYPSNFPGYRVIDKNTIMAISPGRTDKEILVTIIPVEPITMADNPESKTCIICSLRVMPAGESSSAIGSAYPIYATQGENLQFTPGSEKVVFDFTIPKTGWMYIFAVTDAFSGAIAETHRKDTKSNGAKALEWVSKLNPFSKQDEYLKPQEFKGSEGWDGKIAGKSAPPGIYKIKFTICSAITKEYVGYDPPRSEERCVKVKEEEVTVTVLGMATPSPQPVIDQRLSESQATLPIKVITSDGSPAYISVFVIAEDYNPATELGELVAGTDDKILLVPTTTNKYTPDYVKVTSGKPVTVYAGIMEKERKHLIIEISKSISGGRYSLIKTTGVYIQRHDNTEFIIDLSGNAPSLNADNYLGNLDLVITRDNNDGKAILESFRDGLIARSIEILINDEEIGFLLEPDVEYASYHQIGWASKLTIHIPIAPETIDIKIKRDGVLKFHTKTANGVLINPPWLLRLYDTYPGVYVRIYNFPAANEYFPAPEVLIKGTLIRKTSWISSKDFRIEPVILQGPRANFLTEDRSDLLRPTDDSIRFKEGDKLKMQFYNLENGKPADKPNYETEFVITPNIELIDFDYTTVVGNR